MLGELLSILFNGPRETEIPDAPPCRTASMRMIALSLGEPLSLPERAIVADRKLLDVDTLPVLENHGFHLGFRSERFLTEGEKQNLDLDAVVEQGCRDTSLIKKGKQVVLLLPNTSSDEELHMSALVGGLGIILHVDTMAKHDILPCTQKNTIEMIRKSWSGERGVVIIER